MKTAGEAGSWLLIGVALTWACIQAPDTPEPLDEVLEALLVQVGTDIVDGAAAFHGEALELNGQVQAWSDGGERIEAAAAWIEAMAAWQTLELYQIGPAASSLTAAGGANLRDTLYSWPTVNACRVDQETLEQDWDAPSFFDDNLENTYGLDAIEHLLFAGIDTACPHAAGIDDDWAALSAEELEDRRAAYASALSAQVVRDAERLVAAWAPEQGDFGALLASPGSEASPYASPTEALNAVFDAMFYLELRVKDRKLGQPLGLQDCSEATCPEDVESLTSGQSSRWIAINLAAFGQLVDGLAPVLDHRGHPDVATALTTEWAEAQQVADSLQEQRLDELIRTSPQQAQALHDAIKDVADLLKGDVATVLSLTIPAEGSGDND